MAFLAAIAVGGAQAIAGYKKQQAHIAQAAKFREAKNRRMAATTREMAAEQRKQAFIHSRAVVVSAASGAGTDAGMVKLLSDLNAEGQYRVMSVLWSGQNDAEGLIAQAEAEKQAGDDALVMGVVKGVTSAFSAYSAAGGTFGNATPPPAAAASGGASSASRPAGFESERWGF
jgi:hypothetical protein